MSEIKSFDPNIPKDEVERLFRKLKDTRLPEQPIVPDAGWDYGRNFSAIVFDQELKPYRSRSGLD